MMKKTVLLLVAATLALLCVAAPACPIRKDLLKKHPDPPPPPQAFPGIGPNPPGAARSWSNARLGVAMIVPQDWKLVEEERNPVLFVSAPNAGDSGPMANLVIEDLTKRMDPYEYLNANLFTLQNSLPGLEVKWLVYETVDGIRTAWIQYSFPRGGVTVEAMSYCQTVDFTAYVVTGVAPAEVFKDYHPLFRYIGRSLRVRIK